jgi:hypothetical protein
LEEPEKTQTRRVETSGGFYFELCGALIFLKTGKSFFNARQTQRRPIINHECEGRRRTFRYGIAACHTPAAGRKLRGIRPDNH